MVPVATILLGVVSAASVLGFPPPEPKRAIPVYTSQLVGQIYHENALELSKQPEVLRDVLDMLVQVVLQQQSKLEFIERSQISLRTELSEVSMDNTFVKKFVIDQLRSHHSDSNVKPQNVLQKTSDMFLPWDNYFKSQTKLKVDDIVAMNDTIVSLSMRVNALDDHLEEVEVLARDVKEKTVDQFSSIINNVLPELEKRVERKYTREHGIQSEQASSAGVENSIVEELSLGDESFMKDSCDEYCNQTSIQLPEASELVDGSLGVKIAEKNFTVDQRIAEQYQEAPSQIQKVKLNRKVKEVSGNRRKVLGAWMQDGYLLSDTVFIMEGYRNLTVLSEYPNLSLFINDSRQKEHKLPFSCGGTGHVVYNSSIYCSGFKSNKVYKQNLRTLVSNVTRLPGESVRNYTYSIRGFNSIDLMTDSEGIWAVYSNTRASGNIILVKLDPITLHRVYASHTKTSLSSVMNCFMVNGNLFAIQKDNSESPVQIQKVWSVHDPNYVLENKRRHKKTTLSDVNTIVSADFNPKSLRLFFWNWKSFSTASLGWYEFSLV